MATLEPQTYYNSSSEDISNAFARGPETMTPWYKKWLERPPLKRATLPVAPNATTVDAITETITKTTGTDRWMIFNMVSALATLLTCGLTMDRVLRIRKGTEGRKSAVQTAAFAFAVAITNLIAQLIHLSGASPSSLSNLQPDNLMKAIKTKIRTIRDKAPMEAQSLGAFDVVGLVLSMIAAVLSAGIVGAFKGKKDIGEVIGNTVGNWSKMESSCSKFSEVIKKAVSEYDPAHAILTANDEADTLINELKAIRDLPDIDFVSLRTQARIKEIDADFTKIVASLPKANSTSSYLTTTYMQTARSVEQIAQRLRPVITYSNSVRRKPVFVNLWGPPGHGKSYIANQLYLDMCAWMVEEGHTALPMKPITGTGGGDAYLPPFGDQEWLTIDEYLASDDDKWIPVVNQVISDNPTTISSAFIKFSDVRLHFVVTTSNLQNVPYAPAYMRSEVKDAFVSRHNWIEVIKDDYDHTVSRDRQDRTVAPRLVETTVIMGNKNGSYKKERRTITYDQLLRQMQDDWLLLNAKYLKAQETTRQMIEDLSAVTEAVASGPTVIGLFGMPGTGKTYGVQNRIVPPLTHTTTVHNCTTIPESPTGKPGLYIFDDIFTTSDDPATVWTRYKNFYDQCTRQDTIIVIDNYIPKITSKCLGPAALKIALMARVCRPPMLIAIILTLIAVVYCPTIAFVPTLLYFWYDFSAYQTYMYDFSDLPHSSIPRRLGFTEQHYYRGRVVMPAAPRHRAYVLDATFAQDRPESTELRTHEMMWNEVTTLLFSPVSALYYTPGTPVLPEDADIDAILRSVSSRDILAAVTNPTVDNRIHFNRALIKSFPDYESFFRLVSYSEEETKATLDAAFRRLPFSARVLVGTADDPFVHFSVERTGEVKGFSGPGDLTMSITEGDGYVDYLGPSGGLRVTYPDIANKTVSYEGLSPAERTWLASQITHVIVKGMHYNNYMRISVRDAYRADLKFKCAAFWSRSLTLIRDNPIYCSLGLLAMFTTTVLTIIMMRPNDKENEMEHDDHAESYEAKDKATVKKFTRTKLTKPKAESYEPTKRAVNKTFSRQPLRPNPLPAIAEAINVANIPLPMPEYVTSKVDIARSAACFVITGGEMCFGVLVGKNRIVAPGHIVIDRDEPIYVQTHDAKASKSTSWPARIVNLFPERDLAFLEVDDKRFPQQKDIAKHFLKAKDALSASSAILYIPGETGCMVVSNASFESKIAPGSIYDVNVPTWKPSQKIYSLNYFTTTRVTKAGDCGSLVFEQSGKHENRGFMGIHIGTRGHSRGLVASVFQEDLAEGFSTDCQALGVSDDYWTTPESTVILGKEYILTDLLALTMPPTYTDEGHDIPDTDRLTRVGYVAEWFSPSWNKGGEFQNTIISDHLDPRILPKDQAPAPVSIKDPGIHPDFLNAMPKDRCNRPSIGAKQLANISGPRKEISGSLATRVVTSLVAMWTAIPEMRDWRLLSTEETLSGIHEGPYAGLLGPIRLDTSPGMPYKKFKNSHTKGHFIENTAPEGQTPRLAFKEDRAGQLLKQAYDLRWERAHQGQRVMRIVDANLKVECVKLKKVTEGNGRLFLAEALDPFLFQRRIFGMRQAIIMKTRFLTKFMHSTTGINVYVEFKNLFSQLVRVGTHGFDADFSKFDKTIPDWAWAVYKHALILHAKTCGWGLLDQELENLISVLVDDLKEKFYLFEGVLYRSSGDMASGVYPTNIGDSDLLDIIFIACTLTIIDSDDEAREMFLLPDGSIDWNRFNDCVTWFTHGDDFIASVSDEWTRLFNFEVYQDFITGVGMVMTTTDKDNGVYKVKPVKDMSFIGRTFEFDVSRNQPHGKLRKTAINRMVHWTTDTSNDQLEDVLASVEIELRAYPKDEYNVITGELQRAFKKVGIVYPFKSWANARSHLIAQQMEYEPGTRNLAYQSYIEDPKMRNLRTEETISCEDFLSNTFGLAHAGGIEMSPGALRPGLGCTAEAGEEKNGPKGRETGVQPSSSKPAEERSIPEERRDTQGETRQCDSRVTPYGEENKCNMDKLNQTIATTTTTTERGNAARGEDVCGIRERKMHGASLTKQLSELDQYIMRDGARIYIEADAPLIQKAYTNLTLYNAVGFNPTGQTIKVWNYGDFLMRSREPGLIPKYMWANLTCGNCSCDCKGAAALINHLYNSHPDDYHKASMHYMHDVMNYPVGDENQKDTSTQASERDTSLRDMVDGINENDNKVLLYMANPGARLYPRRPETGPTEEEIDDYVEGRVSTEALVDSMKNLSIGRIQEILACMGRPLVQSFERNPAPDVAKEYTSEAGPLVTEQTAVASAPTADAASGAASNAALSAASSTVVLSAVAAQAPDVVGTNPDTSIAPLMDSLYPVEMGLATGPQYSERAVPYIAPELIGNYNIQSSTVTPGTIIATVPWATFGPRATSLFRRDMYMEGPTYVITQTFGAQMTTGALICAQFGFNAPKTPTIDDMLRVPNTIIELNNVQSHTFLLYRNSDNMTTAKTADINSPDNRGLLVIMAYSPIQTAYGNTVEINMKILAKPSPEFRTWEPMPDSGADGSDFTKYRFPRVAYIQTEANRCSNLFSTIPGDSTFVYETPGFSNTARVGGMEVYNTTVTEMPPTDIDNRKQQTGYLCPTLTTLWGKEPSESLLETAVYAMRLRAGSAIKTNLEGAEDILYSKPSYQNFKQPGPVEQPYVDITGTPVGYASIDHPSFDGYPSFVYRKSGSQGIVYYNSFALNRDDLGKEVTPALTLERCTATAFFAQSVPAPHPSLTGVRFTNLVAPLVATGSTGSYLVADPVEEGMARTFLDEKVGSVRGSLYEGDTLIGPIGVTAADGIVNFWMNLPNNSERTLKNDLVIKGMRPWNPTDGLDASASTGFISRETNVRMEDVIETHRRLRKMKDGDYVCPPPIRSFSRRPVTIPTASLCFTESGLGGMILGGALSGIGGGISAAYDRKWMAAQNAMDREMGRYSIDEMYKDKQLQRKQQLDMQYRQQQMDGKMRQFNLMQQTGRLGLSGGPPQLSSYSGASQAIMGKMGYKAGEGLGKQSQGRLTPIVPTGQSDRKGVGFIDTPTTATTVAQVHAAPAEGATSVYLRRQGITNA